MVAWSWSLHACSYSPLLIPLRAPLWTEDSFSLPHLSFSASFKTCLFPLLSLRTGDSTCLGSALLAISQSLSLQKVITHWAHQPRVHSLHPHWLMSLAVAAVVVAAGEARGLGGWEAGWRVSPSWQLLLSRNILMSPLPTKMLRVDRPTPPTLPMPLRAPLLFLKCQRQSRIGQDNKHLNKALSLINERWGGLGRPLTASRR